MIDIPFFDHLHLLLPLLLLLLFFQDQGGFVPLQLLLDGEIVRPIEVQVIV